MDTKTIYDLLKEVRDDQKEHNKEAQETREALVKQGVSIENIKSDISEMKVVASRNTDNIEEHMQRTYQVEVGQEKMFTELERLHVDNLKRIEELQLAYVNVKERVNKLEEPQKAKAWLKKNYLAIASILTATGSLVALASKVLGWW